MSVQRLHHLIRQLGRELVEGLFDTWVSFENSRAHNSHSGLVWEEFLVIGQNAKIEGLHAPIDCGHKRNVDLTILQNRVGKPGNHGFAIGATNLEDISFLQPRQPTKSTICSQPMRR